jgi:hypothetical protein
LPPENTPFPVGAAEGCDLLTLFFQNQKQDQKIAAFGSSYRDRRRSAKTLIQRGTSVRKIR